MEVTTSIREDDGKTQVTVEMTAEEVKEHIDRAFKSFSKTRIPGFRAGKAPRQVLVQNFGGHEVVYEQITSDMINDVAPVAVDEQDILFISDPEFEESGLVADGEPFSFTLFGKVKPDIELLTYDPVEVKMPPEEVTDAEMEMQFAALQDYYFDFETVERAAQEGDFVMVAIEATADGEAVDSLSYESRLVEIGSTVVPAQVSEQIIGMKADETKEFDFTGEEDDIAGKDVHVKVTVKEVREKNVPELDDEFAAKVGFDSFDELHSAIKEQVENQKQSQLPRLKESRCVAELAKRIHGQVPTAYVNFTRENILRDFFNSLQEQGTTFDQFLASNGITSDDFKKDLDQQAQEEAEESLALDALFREQNMEITEEDINKEFEAVADPEATRKSWEEAGRMSVIREAIRRQRATEWLVENAIVTIVEGDEEEEEEEAEEAAE